MHTLLERLLVNSNPNFDSSTFLTILLTFVVFYLVFRLARRFLVSVVVLVLMIYGYVYLRQYVISQGMMTSPLLALNTFKDLLIQLTTGGLDAWAAFGLDIWKTLSVTFPAFLERFLRSAIIM